MTNTTKSVYSFEGEILSEEDDEYNSDSSLDIGGGETNGAKSRIGDPLGVVGEIECYQFDSEAKLHDFNNSDEK